MEYTLPSAIQALNKATVFYRQVYKLRTRQNPLAKMETRTELETETQLRVSLRPPRRNIQWAEDVVDNENMGRKKSNICCIYRKDGEDSCSSDDDKNMYEHQPRYKKPS